MNFVDCLSEDAREAWPLIYRRLTGKRWRAPKKDERGIECHVKIDPKEVEQVMKQTPNVPIDEQGRE